MTFSNNNLLTPAINQQNIIIFVILMIFLQFSAQYYNYFSKTNQKRKVFHVSFYTKYFS